MAKQTAAKRSLARFLAGLAVCGLLTGCGQAASPNDTVGDGTYLLTVDGYGVTEDEYLMFLRDQKAAAANYYWVNYQMQPDDAFWTTEVDGQTPLDYAKQRALDAVVQARTEFILAAEHGVLEYKDYNGMMADMEAENAGRAAKKQSSEAFYGVEQFTAFTYYQYLYSGARSELEYVWTEQADPTDAELRAVYEEYREDLHLGTIYTYEVRYADGTREEVSQNTTEIGKADTITEDLIYHYFSGMQPGDEIKGYFYYDQYADLTLRSVEDLGYQSFEDAKDSLKVFYARQTLQETIASRAQAAQVLLDQPRYDALEMP